MKRVYDQLRAPSTKRSIVSEKPGRKALLATRRRCLNSETRRCPVPAKRSETSSHGITVGPPPGSALHQGMSRRGSTFSGRPRYRTRKIVIQGFWPCVQANRMLPRQDTFMSSASGKPFAGGTYDTAIEFWRERQHAEGRKLHLSRTKNCGGTVILSLYSQYPCSGVYRIKARTPFHGVKNVRDWSRTSGALLPRVWC